MNRALLSFLAFPLAACWSGESAPSTAEPSSSAVPEPLEASAEPSSVSIAHPPLRPHGAIDQRDLISCAMAGSGVICSTLTGGTSSSLVYINERGESAPLSVETDGHPLSLHRVSATAVAAVFEVSLSPEASQTVVFRVCAPWQSAEQVHVSDAPLIDVIEAGSALILLQGGTTAPSLVMIPGDCAQPATVVPIDGARTVSALARDVAGGQIGVTALRSRSLHTFTVSEDTSELRPAAVVELPIQPYVLAGRGPSRWVILPANSPTATLVEGSGDSRQLEEIQLPSAFHRLATDDSRWAGWSASDETLFVGQWDDPSAAAMFPGFPNLRALDFAADGRIVGVDEQGGFVVAAGGELRREGYEGVSAWILAPDATWAIRDRALYELVP